MKASCSSSGGTPQNEVPNYIKVASGLGSITSSCKASSKLLLTIEVFRFSTDEKEKDFLSAPFFLLGSLSSWMSSGCASFLNLEHLLTSSSTIGVFILDLLFLELRVEEELEMFTEEGPSLSAADH